MLQLRAKPDWMHRQLMQVEFVDTGVASWRPVLFSASPGRAGTAAALLPVLLGVFTTVLIGAASTPWSLDCSCP